MVAFDRWAEEVRVLARDPSYGDTCMDPHGLGESQWLDVVDPCGIQMINGRDLMLSIIDQVRQEFACIK